MLTVQLSKDSKQFCCCSSSDGVESSGRKEMTSQAAGAESTESYIASGSSSDHLENREIYHRESKDDRSNKAKKRPMSIKEFNERNRQLQTKEGKRTPAGKVFYYKKNQT